MDGRTGWQLFIGTPPNSNNAIHGHPQSSKHDKQHAVKQERRSITHSTPHTQCPWWQHTGENSLLTPRPPCSPGSWVCFSHSSEGTVTDDSDNKSWALLRWSAASPPSPMPLIHWSIYLWWCDQPLAIRDAVWKLLLSFKYLLPSQANLCLKCVYWFWSACQYLALCYHTPSHLHQLMLRKKRERDRGRRGRAGVDNNVIQCFNWKSGCVYLLDVFLFFHGYGLFIHLPKFLKAWVRSVWLQGHIPHWLKGNHTHIQTQMYTYTLCLQLFPGDKDPDVSDSEADCRVWGN